MQRPTPYALPALDSTALLHSQAMAAHLRDTIQAAGGYLGFDAWMTQALYAPGLGYYAAGNMKLADATPSAQGAYIPAGDFVTAPELTPLFAQSLAQQVAQVLHVSASQTILEFGAGTGALTEDLLNELEALGIEANYQIIEVSAELRARQQSRLAGFGDRVQWLDNLPVAFHGCVLANEVLDAMPVSLFCWSDTGDVLERGVGLSRDGQFIWKDRPAPDALATAVAARMPVMPGYVSEIHLKGEAWIRAMAVWLQQGAALLIDYGFPRHEYYHPQRMAGTLMCHLRHHAHADPFIAPGVQDLTAHVDFTAMADAAFESSLQVLGYTSQAHFLMNAGIMERVAQLDPTDVRRYTEAVAPVQKLLSESEMGELFKVLALGHGIDTPLIGFTHGDRLHTL